MSDGRLSSHQVFHYRRAVAAPAQPAADVEVTPAQAADLRAAEAAFVQRGDQVALAAEDLCEKELLLDSVCRHYRPLALERRREVLVARRRGRRLGFALLEVSSVGLNLSELTSAFRLCVPGGEPEARAALVRAAAARYQQLGRPATALVEGPDLDPFGGEAAGGGKRYVSWTLHRSLIATAFDSVLAGLYKEQDREGERLVPHGERDRVAAVGAEDRSARVVA
jgi:hypothetical protein